MQIKITKLRKVDLSQSSEFLRKKKNLHLNMSSQRSSHRKPGIFIISVEGSLSKWPVALHPPSSPPKERQGIVVLKYNTLLTTQSSDYRRGRDHHHEK